MTFLSRAGLGFYWMWLAWLVEVFNYYTVMAMVMDTLVSFTTQSLGPFWRCFFLALVMRKKYRTSLQPNWTHVDTCGHMWTQLDRTGHSWTKLDRTGLDTIGQNWTFRWKLSFWSRLRVVRLVKNEDEQRLGVSKNWSFWLCEGVRG
jgi:hypothetical protein